MKHGMSIKYKMCFVWKIVLFSILNGAASVVLFRLNAYMYHFWHISNWSSQNRSIAVDYFIFRLLFNIKHADYSVWIQRRQWIIHVCLHIIQNTLHISQTYTNPTNISFRTWKKITSGNNDQFFVWIIYNSVQ